MLTFAHLWVIALLPLPWLLRALLPRRWTGPVAVRVPFGDRLRAAASERGGVSQATRRAARQIAPILVWVLVVAALARPQWIEPPMTRSLPTRDLLLLVDLSGSMRQEDFTDASGAKVDRLRAVKEVLGAFLARREGDRVGLIVFGDAAFLQCPFSDDLGLSRQLLDETVIGMAGPRTALGDAIGLGLTVFESSDAPARTMIALTDGNDTSSQVPPIEAARVARERNVRIHTIAIGDPTTAGEEKLDVDTLRAVARCGGGSYFFAADRRALEGIYEALDAIETRDVQVISHRPRRDLFFWALLGALAVWLAETLALIARDWLTAIPAHPSVSVRVDRLTGQLEVLA